MSRTLSAIIVGRTRTSRPNVLTAVGNSQTPSLERSKSSIKTRPTPHFTASGTRCSCSTGKYLRKSCGQAAANQTRQIRRVWQKCLKRSLWLQRTHVGWADKLRMSAPVGVSGSEMHSQREEGGRVASKRHRGMSLNKKSRCNRSSVTRACKQVLK